jgi:hypothetical protein
MHKCDTALQHSVTTQRHTMRHSVVTQRHRQIVAIAYFLISCDRLSLFVSMDCNITKCLIYIQYYGF